MPYLYLLIGIVDLILVFINREWGFTLAVVLGIIYVIFGLYEVFMPRKQVLLELIILLLFDTYKNPGYFSGFCIKKPAT